MEDKIFKQDAKQIVDMVFDAKLFKDELTRDNLNSIEDIIQFMLQSRFDSYQKLDKLTKSIEGRTNKAFSVS